MRKRKKKAVNRVIGLTMTAMMLVTSNSVVMASDTPWQMEENELAGNPDGGNQKNSGMEENLADTGPVNEGQEQEAVSKEQGENQEGESASQETLNQEENLMQEESKPENSGEVLEGQSPLQMSETDTENVFLYDKNDSDQTAVITGYEGDEAITSLIIPGEIDGYTVVGIGDSAFRSYSSLTEIIFPESLSSIDRYAFQNCTSLEKLSFPKNLANIGYQAFEGCSALKTAEMNEGLQELGSNVFSDCKELTEVRFPSTLAAVGYSGAFSGCEKLEKVTFSYGMEKTPDYVCRNMQALKTIVFEGSGPDGSKIAAIGKQSFSSCSALEGVELPAGVITIENNAFESCNALIQVSFPAGLTTIEGSAFHSCSSLAAVEFPGSVAAIGENAFSNCSALAQIGLNEGLQELGSNGFSNCKELTEVRIPSTLAVVGYSGAFSGCEKLEKITFSYGMEKIPDYVCRNMQALKTIVFEGSGTDGSKITAIGRQSFSSCSALEGVELPAGVITIENNAFESCSALNRVSFPAELTTIESSAFYSCSSLAAVEFPGSVVTIGENAFSNCGALAQIGLNEGLQELGSNGFSNCKELTEVRIPSTLAAVGYSGAFAGCEKLEKVTFSYGMEKTPGYVCRSMQALKIVVFEDGNGNPCKITTIGTETFRGCSNLETVTLPQSLTTIEDNAFHRCTSLLAMIFPKNLVEIRNSAFYGCSALKEVLLNEGLKELGSNVFQSCSELKEVRIPASLETAGDGGVFRDCAGLEKVIFAYGRETVPNHICRGASGLKEIVWEGNGGSDSKITSIGNYAFCECRALEILELPKSIINIGKYAFSSCGNLVEIKFQEGLKSIEDGAFESCSALNGVILPDSLEQIGEAAFRACDRLDSIYIGRNVSEIKRNAFYLYNQKELLLFTANDMAKQYAWGDNRREVLSTDEIYKAGDSIKAGIFETGLIAFLGAGNMDNWTADTQPWKNRMKDISSLYISGNIKNIGDYMLAGSSATALILEGASLESIGRCAFEGCSSLTYIEIGDSVAELGADAFAAEKTPIATVLHTENSVVKDYDWSGSNRKIQEQVEVYKLDRYVAAYVSEGNLIIQGRGNMPDYGSGSVPWKDQAITSATITKGIRKIGNYSFYDLKTLQSVRIPEGLTSIGENAFANCTAIQEIVLPKSVNRIAGQAFYNCSSLVSINLNHTGISEIPYSAFEECQSLRVMRIPASVKTVENNAFKNCVQLNSLTLSDGVSRLGSDVFYGCQNLASVEIPRSLNTVEISSTGGPFAASGLTSVSFAPRTRKVINGLFMGCTSLKSVTIPEMVSEIGENAFDGCTSLTQIRLPKLLYSVESYAFHGCSGLKDIVWPEDLQEIGNYAFYECKSIEELPLLPYLISIGSYAFYGCESLASVALGGEISSINESSFGKTGLKTVNVPYKVRQIDSRAFAENSSLTKLTIPAGTGSIADDILEGGASFITIGGSAGSEAEKFAQNQGYGFQAGIAAEQAVLSRDTISLAKNQTAQIQAKIVPVSATDPIVWESDDETVASVAVNSYDPSTAVIRSGQEGQTEVRVKAGAVTASCKVEVDNYATEIIMNESYISMAEISGTYTLEARVIPSDAKNKGLVWKTSDKNIVSVEVQKDDSEGGNTEKAVLTAMGRGIARITVSTADGAVKNSCFVNVSAQVPVEGISLSEEELLFTGLGRKRQLSAEILPEGAANQKVQWASTNETVATVDQKGWVTPVSEGKAEITVTTEDGGKTASCEVTVQFAKILATGVSLGEKEIILDKIGASRQLNAQVQPADADIKDIQWLSADAAVASVDENGKVTARGGGTTTITARTKDGGYEEKCQVKVKSLIETITVDPASLRMQVGETAPLKAEITPYSTDIQWYSTNTKAASVDKNGLVAAKAAGRAVIKCRALDGTNVTASCQVEVSDGQDLPPEDTKITSITLNRKTAGLSVGGSLKLQVSVMPSGASVQGLRWSSSNDKVAFVSQQGKVSARKKGKAVITVYPAASPEKKASCTITVKKPKVADIKITSVKPGKKQMTVKWKKAKVSGYQLQYSLKRNFSSKKSALLGKSKVQRKITKLKAKRKYYVRIRAYLTVNGQKYYGSWSPVKSKKVK